ncbi:MAG TPA: hypothetical protein PLL21_03060 [Sedimentibacter sp.]|nr:hypothetical protein [Sedimentibacter sp.]HQB63338.1 hypothetical protein [Sedimentibacter sp.]
MIDMHNHLLFGVDDGPETIEESLELIKEATSRGVTHIIITPHFNKRNNGLNHDKVSINFQLLKEAIDKESIKIGLYLGNEVYMDSVGYASIIDNGFNTLAGSRYLLVEFNEMMPPSNIPEICYELTISGYIPIIAHAERYGILYNNSKLLGEILDEGAHLQVNASTIVNKENHDRNKFARYLLKNELVSFAASDVHNNTSRRFYLNEAYAAVCKLCSITYAYNIFKQNPMNIINNKKFESPKLPRATRQKGGRQQLINLLFRK